MVVLASTDLYIYIHIFFKYDLRDAPHFGCLDLKHLSFLPPCFWHLSTFSLHVFLDLIYVHVQVFPFLIFFYFAFSYVKHSELYLHMKCAFKKDPPQQVVFRS